MKLPWRRAPEPPPPRDEPDPELALHHGRADRAVKRANEALQRAAELYDARLRGNHG